MLKRVVLLQEMKRLAIAEHVLEIICSAHCSVSCRNSKDQNTSTPPYVSGPSYQQCHQQFHPSCLGLCLPSFLLSVHSFSFFIRLQQHKQTNTPRLAANMALFQPRDWFSAAQLTLAIRIVCQKMDECNLSKSTSTMFHISIEEKLFLDSNRYGFIAQP